MREGPRACLAGDDECAAVHLALVVKALKVDPTINPGTRGAVGVAPSEGVKGAFVNLHLEGVGELAV